MKLDVKLEKINFQYYIIIKNNIYINITKEKYEELEKTLVISKQVKGGEKGDQESKRD